MGTSVTVAVIPPCAICSAPAAYDAKTIFGPWANLCEKHFQDLGIGLGTGRGQRLVLRSAAPRRPRPTRPE